jgi:hypothetical protein
MSDLDDLLEIIAVPPTDAAADAARGERTLRRRRRTQVGAVVASVAAVAAVGFAVHDSSGSPGAAGFADGTAASSSAHGKADHHAHRASQHVAKTEARLQSESSTDVLRTYHDVLAEHLDASGDHLRLAQNEQGGSGTFGTKLDWNGGGMLEIVVSRSWGGAWHFYALENAGMTPTTYDGLAARVSTKSDDLVVSVQHQDLVRQQRHLDLRPGPHPARAARGGSRPAPDAAGVPALRSAGGVVQPERHQRAVANGMASGVVVARRYHRVPVAGTGHREPEVVHVEKPREELGAAAVTVAAGPVDVEARLHDTLRIRLGHQPARWADTWSRNTSSVEATNRALPSGWAHAPRPLIWAPIREMSSGSRGSRTPDARRWRFLPR